MTIVNPFETAGSVAFISTPKTISQKPESLFTPAPSETAGSVASATPSLCGSTPAGCGSNCNTTV